MSSYSKTTKRIQPLANSEPPPINFELSPIDQLMPRAYIRWLLYFSVNTDIISTQKLLEDICSAFSKLLINFPPLMANVVSEADTGIQSLVYSSNDILLEEAWHDFNSADGYITDFLELERQNFPIAELPGEKIFPVDPFPKSNSVAVFAIQVNILKGGIILAPCIHHAICDAAGFHHLLKCFAMNLKGFTNTALDYSIFDRSWVQCLPVEDPFTGSAPRGYNVVDLVAPSTSFPKISAAESKLQTSPPTSRRN